MGLGESTSEPVSPKSAAASGAAGGTGTSGRRLKPWPQLKEAVQTAIATANSHTEMMQDMLLNLSKEGSDDYDFQRGFLNDLSGVGARPSCPAVHITCQPHAHQFALQARAQLAVKEGTGFSRKLCPH